MLFLILFIFGLVIGWGNMSKVCGMYLWGFRGV